MKRTSSYLTAGISSVQLSLGYNDPSPIDTLLMMVCLRKRGGTKLQRAECKATGENTKPAEIISYAGASHASAQTELVT